MLRIDRANNCQSPTYHEKSFAQVGKMAAMLNQRQILLVLLLRRRLARRKTKRCWVRKIFRERKTKGEYHLLIKELQLYDHELFFKQFRMSPAKYEELLSYVGPRISKTSKREPIGPSERLCVTLRYLVSGDAHITIAASYRISPTSIGRIVKETCPAIWDALCEKGFLKVPNDAMKWKDVADEFERKWNFPNCLGAIDGKHVMIQAPPRSGSTFFNYKKFHSIVLLAVVNANYEFTMVDIGDAGRQSDAGVFSSSKLGYAMNHGLLNTPSSRQLGSTNKHFPYVFVGDEAFPLKTFLIRPYPRSCLTVKERIANYRMSRARRIVENAFGICATRFRILRRPIVLTVQTIVQVVKAVVALHNFLMCGRSFGNYSSYCPPGYVDQETEFGITPGQWRGDSSANTGLQPLLNASSNNYTQDARIVRDNFRDYFNSEEGSVPWQNAMVTSTSNRFDEN